AGAAAPHARVVRDDQAADARHAAHRGGRPHPDPLAAVLALDAVRGGAGAGRAARRDRPAREPGDLLARDDGVAAVPADRRAVAAVRAAGPAAGAGANGVLRRRLWRLLGG